MMLGIQLRGRMVVMVVHVMSNLSRNDRSCRQCCQYLRTQSGIGFGT